jgi:hypothetical protein
MTIANMHKCTCLHKFSDGTIIATVKKPKSPLRTGGEMTQECILSDGTGDIEAEVLINGLKLDRGNEITIVAAELQSGAGGKKLYVSEYEQKRISEPEPYQPKEQHYSPAEVEQNTGTNWDEIARRGIRKDLVCALISSRTLPAREPGLQFIYDHWTDILALTEQIFTGK